MMYIENIFLLVSMPLVAALFCLRGRSRVTIAALLTGMAACLVSAYVSSFIAQFVHADAVRQAVEVAPVVEETAKLLPLLFYVIVVNPEVENADLAFICVAVGFATMESAFYLGDNGVSAPNIIAFRGLSAGMMHIACGMLMGFGFVHIWRHSWLRAAGTFGVLCLVITYHGLYNLLIATQGAAYIAAAVMSLFTLTAVLMVRRRERLRQG